MRLLLRAERNPGQLNDTSVADAMATPATMGNNDPMIPQVGTSPRMLGVRATEKNGSVALTVCVKATETFPRDMFVSTNPAACNTPSGRTDRSINSDIGGGFFKRSTHVEAMRTVATANCTHVMVSGYGNARRACLLRTLNAALDQYHIPNRPSNTRVDNAPELNPDWRSVRTEERRVARRTLDPTDWLLSFWPRRTRRRGTSGATSGEKEPSSICSAPDASTSDEGGVDALPVVAVVVPLEEAVGASDEERLESDEEPLESAAA